MNNVFAWLLDLMKKQGLSFGLLVVAIWYFYGEVQRLERKSDLCQDNVIELYQNVILQNTRMLEEVDQELDETQRILRSHNERSK